MKDKLQNDFDALLRKYRALSHERLHVENEILKVYDSLRLNDGIIITDKAQAKEIISLREKLAHIKKEMNKVDRQIFKVIQSK